MNRVARNQPDGLVEFAEAPSRPDEGAARAESRDEVGDAAAGLLDDFRRRRVVVRAPVSGVVMLVDVEVRVRLGCASFHGLEGWRHPILASGP